MVGPVLPAGVFVVVVEPGAAVMAEPELVEEVSVEVLVWVFSYGFRAGTGFETVFLLIQLVPFHVLPSGHEMHSPLCSHEPGAQLV